MATAATIGLTEAADQLGVHYMTAYRYIRTGRLAAEQRNGQWRVRPRDLAALGTTRPGRPGVRRPARLAARMVAGDAAGAWRVVEEHLGGGADAPVVLSTLLVPALRSIGSGWADGRITVAQEHRATAVAVRVLGKLSMSFGRRGPRRGTVILCAPEGDLHQLPVSIAADLLRWHGFDVHELGAHTPPDALVDALDRHDTVMGVGIAASSAGLEPAVRAAIGAVRATRRHRSVPVVVGGGAVTSERQAEELGADEWGGGEATGAVAAMERLHRTAGATPR